MAGAFTNQPRTTPITNQQVANQLGRSEDASGFNQAMQSGMQPGTGGGMGPGGNIYPLGGGMAHTTIYAVVESGLPIILNPKTGEPYPPGYIPSIQDPNTWEQWQPGQSWMEVMALAKPELAEALRMSQEILLRPIEEGVANTVAGEMKNLGNASKKWSGQLSKSIHGEDNATLKGIQQRGAEASRQAINQAPKIAQEAVRQAPQAAQRVGQAAQRLGQGAGQVFDGASKFVSGGGSARLTTGEARSALTPVVGDRPVFSSGSARRN